MKVLVQSTKSHLSRIASTRFSDDQLIRQEEIPCEGDVFVTLAFIDYEGVQNNHRPFLHLVGEIKGIRGTFPCNVDEVTFGDTRFCPRVEYCYQFSNQELAELCEKGLFDKGFKCPDIFRENTFELPMTCSCTAIRQEQKNEVPLMFIEIEHPYNLETSSELSGYNLASYFEDQKVIPTEDTKDAEFDALSQTHDFMFEETVEDENELEDEIQEVEVSEEDILLQQAFENIETRVQNKLVQDETERESATEEPSDTSVLDDKIINDDKDSNKENEKSKVNAAKQYIVEQNQKANEEEKHRQIPAAIQEVAEQAETTEYVSSDDIGMTI